MKNSNVQIGKCYKEQSPVWNTFRYIKVSEVVGRGSEIVITGTAVTALNDRYPNCSYYDQGEWIEISEAEFDEAYSNSKYL